VGGKIKFCNLPIGRYRGAIVFKGGRDAMGIEIPSLSQGSVFADSRQLRGLLEEFYSVAIGEIFRSNGGSSNLPIGRLASKVLADPLTRASIHDHLVGMASAETVLERLDRLRSRDNLAMEMTVSVADVPLWSPRDKNSWSAKTFETEFDDKMLPNRLIGTKSDGALVPANEELTELTKAAVRKLHQAVPQLTNSVLSHIDLICWARVETQDAVMTSGSSRPLPGVIFLSPDRIDSEASAAEAILHEAAHHKLFDIFIALDCIDPSYRAIEWKMPVVVPWNKDHSMQTASWPPDQALLALHIYLHLAYFAHRTNQDALLVRAKERATFLANSLEELNLDGFLLNSGKQLLSWCSELAQTQGSLTEFSDGWGSEASVSNPFLLDGRLACYYYDVSTGEIARAEAT